MTSQSLPILEYTNLCSLGIRQNKQVQEGDKKVGVKPNLFGLILIFAYVAISSTNSILSETGSFAAKMLHHKEISKYLPDNLPKFTNPLAYNIEAGNENFTFKEYTSQPDMLEFLESMSKDISDHEDDRHWNLVRRRDLNQKIP